MSQPAQFAVARRKPWYQSPWLAPFNDAAAINELIRRLQPRASVNSIRASVLKVIDETADTRTFVLQANRHWTGFNAGQHLLVTIDVDGRKLQRCFSISSAPSSARCIDITVKRHSTHGVTAWMHAHLNVGDIVELSAPIGRFSLESSTQPSVLMLSAGSGITPLMSMLRDLQQRNEISDVVFVHTCRHADDLIFASQLRALAAEQPGLKLIVHHSADSGRLHADALRELVPDFAQRASLLCGPPAFADWVKALYQAESASHLLQSEQFGIALPEATADDGALHAVACANPEQSFTVSPGQPLLLAAEAAGLTPRHGCRIGICRSCQCVKRSGRVENLLTGEICAEPNQLIQLCISAARSPITLDLQGQTT